MTTKLLTLLAVAITLDASAAIAPMPPSLTIVAIPPPSPGLLARCQSASEWKRYGSVETCEQEKRQDELIAFQQARINAEQTVGYASEERTLKRLGFDRKAEPLSDESAESEPENFSDSDQ